MKTAFKFFHNIYVDNFTYNKSSLRFKIQTTAKSDLIEMHTVT